MPLDVSPWERREARDAMEKLLAEPPNVTDSLLHEDGRYFSETCSGLTRCYHGDTGNYDNDADGQVLAVLWNAWQCGLLQVVPPPVPE